jgi:hypothetical protein
MKPHKPTIRSDQKKTKRSASIGKATKPRQGWEAAFRAMHNRHDDILLDGELSSLSSWDYREWEWR